MLQTIRARLILLVLLVAGAIFSLIPREQSVRAWDARAGRMRDTVVTRVPLSLGLDLQGGIHLGLEIDDDRLSRPRQEDDVDRALTVIRTRIDEFGTKEPVVQKVGEDRIVVELPGEGDPERAKAVVQRSAFLEFQITDMQERFRGLLSEMDEALVNAGFTDTSQAAAPDAATALDQLLGSDTAQADTSADAAAAAAPVSGSPFSSLLFAGSLPGEFLVPEEQVQLAQDMLNQPALERLIPRGLEVLWGSEIMSLGARAYRPFYVVDEDPIITGAELTDANAQFDNTFNQAVVQFSLTRSGGRRFSRETGEHIGDYMAIVLDNRVVSQPPVIRGQISNQGQIELGNATIQEAQDLALVLRAGALPVPLSIVEERTVGPTLGADSIDKARIAGIVGIALLVGIMLWYYRFAGVLAVGALVLYVLFTLGGLAAFEASLTLPGLAGLILSLGMALDANVLIFERIREELALSKSIPTAVKEGFSNAMSAIIDSNVTTVLTALFLFQFGTGPVKGFAVALVMGIIASFVTAVFVTRTFFMVWLKQRPGLTSLSI